MFENLNPNKNITELEDLKSKVVEAIDEDIKSSQRSIDEMSKMLTDFKKYKYPKHDSFFNFCIFSDFLNIDLTILLEKIQFATREQEKKLYARIIAVTIIDFLDNINVLLGHDCVLELKKNNMTEFIDDFRSIHKQFSVFKKDNEKILRDIRNNAIAHKSKDALKLNAVITNLNVEEVYSFGLKLKIQSKEFVDLSTKVIYYIIAYMEAGRKI